MFAFSKSSSKPSQIHFLNLEIFLVILFYYFFPEFIIHENPACWLANERSGILWVRTSQAKNYPKKKKAKTCRKYEQTKREINKIFTKHSRSVPGRTYNHDFGGNIFPLRTSSLVNNIYYYMAELIFRSIRQITHVDWLLRSRYFT